MPRESLLSTANLCLAELSWKLRVERISNPLPDSSCADAIMVGGEVVVAYDARLSKYAIVPYAAKPGEENAISVMRAFGFDDTYDNPWSAVREGICAYVCITCDEYRHRTGRMTLGDPPACKKPRQTLRLVAPGGKD